VKNDEQSAVSRDEEEKATHPVAETTPLLIEGN